MTVFIDEFGELLDRLHHAKYMAGFSELLLKVYDGREHRYTRHSKRRKDGAAVRDEDHVRDPHLSLLGATTPTLFEELADKDVRKGLIPRFAVIMPVRKPRRLGFHDLQDSNMAARDELVERLHAIYVWAKTARRPVHFAPGALEAVDDFAVRLEQEAARLDPGARAMLQRVVPMAVKVAMLAAIGRAEAVERDELLVTLDDAAAAVAVAARWRDDALAFAGRLGETDLERKIQRCLRLVEQRPAIARRVIAQNVHVDKRTLDSIQETLIDRGLITVRKVTLKGRPSLLLWERL
jgi:hypothetical protein